MRTRTIAATVVFAALAIVLNLSPLKFSAPYAPYLKYQIWEIPIVAAFLLFGVVTGVLVATINTAVLVVWFPGDLPSGPYYNLAAVLSTLLGIGIVKLLVKQHSPKHDAVVAVLCTAAGTTLRTVTMVLANYAFLRYPYPIGYSMPEGAIIANIPLIAVFNATLALYTIPVAYSIAKVAKPFARM